MEETDSLDLDVVTRIEAALPLPAPRFMQDIVGVAGSAAAASAWGEESAWSRSGGVHQQPKHRQRGSLPVPKDILRTRTPNFNKSPWGRALSENYPAGRLYELALVLRRLEPNIVAIGFRKHAVEITYRVAGGIAGLVVGLAAGEDPGCTPRSARSFSVEDQRSDSDRRCHLPEQLGERGDRILANRIQGARLAATHSPCLPPG